MFCKISYRVPIVQARISVRIFSLDGILFYELENNTISASSGFIEWDGKILSGSQIEAGGYVLVIEAIDIQNGRVVKDLKSMAMRW